MAAINNCRTEIAYYSERIPSHRMPYESLIVKCKLVFDLKRNSTGFIVRYKDLLVDKCYSKIYGVEYTEIFAPVTILETFRFLLAFLSPNDYELIQLEAKTDF